MYTIYLPESGENSWHGFVVMGLKLRTSWLVHTNILASNTNLLANTNVLARERKRERERAPPGDAGDCELISEREHVGESLACW